MNGMAELARAIVGGGSSPRSSEHLATVLRRGADGTYWVHIPGGADETPITTTMTDASEGDTVRVSISGGRSVMTGNVTSPSSTVRTVGKVGGVANRALTLAYTESARIDKLQTTMLTADSAVITDLQADTAKVHDLTANQLSAATAFVADLDAEDIDAESITADHMAVNNLYVDEEAVNNLNAKYAHITDGVIDNAKISYADVDDLAANFASIEELSTGYARIDAANITEERVQREWVDKIMVQTGLISQEANIFSLAALQVNAANITAGTLDVQRLIFTEPGEGGEPDKKYLITWDETEQTFVQAYLDGGFIAENSIAADRIVSNSITTEQLTTNNIGSTNGWINFASGEFEFVDADGAEGISFLYDEEQDRYNLTIMGAAVDVFAKADAVDALDAAVESITEQVGDLNAHVRIEARGGNPVIVLDAAGGLSGTGMSAELSNTALSFLDNGVMVAEVSNNKLTITDAEIRTAHVDENLSIGRFAWIPMSDNSLSFKWIGA